PAKFLGPRHLELRPPRNIQRKVIAQRNAVEDACGRGDVVRIIRGGARLQALALVGNAPAQLTAAGNTPFAFERVRIVNVLALRVEGIEVADRARGRGGGARVNGEGRAGGRVVPRVR